LLFTVNKSPFLFGHLDSCLQYAIKDTPILLIEDGVYAASKGTSYEKKLKEALGKFEIYALGPDLKARGIASVIDGVKIVDYAGFVDLAEKHNVAPWI